MSADIDHKHAAQIFEFGRRIGVCGRPFTFEETWAVVDGLPVCGFYKDEAAAIWRTLRHENRKRPIKKLVEIGRNKCGGLFLLVCACVNVEHVWSFDIKAIPYIDKVMTKWLVAQGIEARLVEIDSTRIGWVGTDDLDFVYIDGGHTGDCVRRDIQQWKNRTRLIGFHDYADKGARNKHKRVFKDVVKEIDDARQACGWQQIGDRGRSEIVFRTKNGEGWQP